MPRLTPAQIIFLLFLALLIFSGGDLRLLSNPGRLGPQATQLLITAVAIILAITVHEANHAFAAVSLGDETPRRMGRLSLNPIRHLDPLGTLLLFVAHFGWGKPVMFNPGNLRINPLIGSAVVSFAGPLANILFAIVLNVALSAFGPSLDPLPRAFLRFLRDINILLAAFNLVPIPPLDGFGVLQGLLPPRLAYALEPLRQYGPIILLGAIFLPRLVGGPDIIGAVMSPLVEFIASLVESVS